MRYNAHGKSNDGATAVATDALRNVYVTGGSFAGNGNGLDIVTVKYSAAGIQLWAQRYNGAGKGDDVPVAIGTDADANVYVAGRTWGGAPPKIGKDFGIHGKAGTDFDYVLIKYSPEGDELWVRTYNGFANSYDSASAMALDSAGNVYLTGLTVVNPNDEDCGTLKYSPDGVQLWLQIYAGVITPGGNRATAIAAFAFRDRQFLVKEAGAAGLQA